MNRQKALLLILLVVLAIAVVFAFIRRPKLQTVKKLKFAPGGHVEAKKVDTAKADEKRLKLALLEQALPRFAGFKRNIFWLRPYETEKKLPPPPPPPAPPSPPPPPPPSPEELLSQAAQAEMAKFVFLGFLLKNDRKTVFLSKDHEIFVVKKGDKIANKFEVTNVTNEAMTINSTSGRAEVIIPLIENKPLSATKR